MGGGTSMRNEHVAIPGTLALFMLTSLVFSGDEPKKPTQMLTGSPKELLPACSADESRFVKVQIKQVKENVLELTVPDTGGYYLEFGVFLGKDGKKLGTPLMWGDGATHEIFGPTTIGGYEIVPDNGKSLTFKVETKRGYIFVSGAGQVKNADGAVTKLSTEDAGLVVGHPVREFVKYEGLLVIRIGKPPEGAKDGVEKKRD